MYYLSTRNNQLRETFRNILFQGLSKDGGLFLPESWPSIKVDTLWNKSYEEVALHIIYPFVDKDISKDDLYEIIQETYKNFTDPKIAPLVNIDKNKYILELFYGPTLAFKDYALQFLGNLFSHMMKNTQKKITVLGATSGDTGSAAINAFKGKSNINIFVLHPYNKISEVQRRQMTTVFEDNVFNIALEGSFDDCQKIVKDLFLNNEIQKKTSLASVNSINWARLMAQTVYYFWAYLQLEERKVNFVVPSGNFGNIFSARVAQHMGLPIKQLHIVTNKNDTLNQIISLGQMEKSKVKNTYSPSMDIQVSSNFERQIFESVKKDSNIVNSIFNDFNANRKYEFDINVKEDFQNIYHCTSVSNEKTLETIQFFHQKYNYLADPHTAVGLSVLNDLGSEIPNISLACAHPAKFADVINKATGKDPFFPKELDNIFYKEEKMTILPNNSEDVKSFILKQI